MKQLLCVILIITFLNSASGQNKDVHKAINYVIDSLILKEKSSDSPDIINPCLLKSETVNLNAQKLCLNWEKERDRLKGFDSDCSQLSIVEKINLAKVVKTKSNLFLNSSFFLSPRKIDALKGLFKIIWLSSPKFSINRKQCLIQVETTSGGQIYLLNKERSKWKMTRMVVGWEYDY